MGYHRALPGVGAVVAFPYGVSNATGVDIARIKSMTLEFNEEDVPLEDENGDEIDSFIKSSKVGGKIELEEMSARLISASVGGTTVTAGGEYDAVWDTTIPTTPFEVTPTPPNSGTWKKCLAVIDLTAEKLMSAGATASGTGVYAIGAAGKLTFNTADAGHVIRYRYRYTSSTIGKTTEVAQSSTGQSTKYELYYGNTKNGVLSGLWVPYARIKGLSATLSKDGWSSASLTWSALVSPLGKKIYTYTPE